MQNKPQLSAEMEKLAREHFMDSNGFMKQDWYYRDGGRILFGEIKHFLATALEEQRATFLYEVKNRKATIKWLWGKQKTDDECFLMVMEQVKKIADVLNGKDTNE